MKTRLALSVLVFAAGLWGDEPYHKPPADVLKVLNASPTPEAIVSPKGDTMLLAERILYPPVAIGACSLLSFAALAFCPRHRAAWPMA